MPRYSIECSMCGILALGFVEHLLEQAVLDRRWQKCDDGTYLCPVCRQYGR